MLPATSVMKLHCICRPRAATRLGLGECHWTCAYKGRRKANDHALGPPGAARCAGHVRLEQLKLEVWRVSRMHIRHVVVLWAVEL